MDKLILDTLKSAIKKVLNEHEIDPLGEDSPFAGNKPNELYVFCDKVDAKVLIDMITMGASYVEARYISGEAVLVIGIEK